MKTYRRSAAVRAFTIIEIMIALVIVGVLATVGIPTYQNFIEDGRSQMCSANLEALKSAFDVYMVEHNVVPGDLGLLDPGAVERAYAKAMRAKGWNARFLSFLERNASRGYAFANLVQELGKGNLKMLVCPSDPRTRTGSATEREFSYGINQEIASMTKEEYETRPDNLVILADSNDATFTSAPSSASERHKRIKTLSFATVRYANSITKGGWVRKEGERVTCYDCRHKEYSTYYPGTSGQSYATDYNKQWGSRKKEIQHCWQYECLK